MLKALVTCLAATLVLAGCKSESSAPPPPLHPTFAGYWAAEQFGANCSGTRLRFDRDHIVSRFNVPKVPTILIRTPSPPSSHPMFRIVAAEIRGSAADLTLTAAIPEAAKKAMEQSGRQRISVDQFRIHVQLINHGTSISLSDVQMENPMTGRIPVQGRGRRKYERIFTLSRCPD